MGERIVFNTYDGIIPILAPKLLPQNAAQIANNVDLQSQRLEPWKVPLSIQGSPGTTSIFPWYRNGVTSWIGWNSDVDVVRSPVAEDQWSRIYLTGDGLPKVRGWDGGEVTKNMKQTQASAPTATPAFKGVLATLLNAFKSSTMTIIANLSAYGTNGAIDGYLQGTPSSVRMSDDYSEIYLEFSQFGQYGNDSSYTLYEPDPPVSSGVVNLSWGPTIGIPTPYGTLSGTVAMAIGTIGTASISSTTLGKVINFSQGDVSHFWSTNPVNTVPGLRHYFSIAWSAFPETVKVTVKITFTDPNFGRVSENTKYVYYVQTLVNEWGMEGPASTTSNLVQVNPGEKVTLAGFGSAASDTVTRRFYRSAAGTDSDEFYYLGEVAVGATSYDDTKDDAELSEILPLFENPPDNLAGLVMMPNGSAAGFVGREVLPSEPYYPWSYPTKYRIPVDYNIVGLGVAGNSLYVFTTGENYVITGDHPENYTCSKIAFPQSCSAKRSIVTYGNMVLYASPDGVCGLFGSQGKLMTEYLYKKTQWAALTPSGIIAGIYDNRYFCFHSTGCVIFRFGEGADTVTTSDEVIAGLHVDLETDSLYIILNGYIQSWNAGATNKTLVWRSKEFAVNRRTDWSSGRVVADSYPLTFRIYTENTLAATITVTSQDSFRIPILVPKRVCSIEVEGAMGIDYIGLATSMKLLS